VRASLEVSEAMTPTLVRKTPVHAQAQWAEAEFLLRLEYVVSIRQRLVVRQRLQVKEDGLCVYLK
jgi:hypothetical protein